MNFENDSHCEAQVKQHDPDRFILSLYAPKEIRGALLAVYALNIELAHVREVITEEVIGQVRLAWWDESIAKLYKGEVIKGHPILGALKAYIDDGVISEMSLQPIIESYREYFPEIPQDSDRLLEQAAVTILRNYAPVAQSRWTKANNIIKNHRRNYTDKPRNGWLHAKLLFA